MSKAMSKAEFKKGQVFNFSTNAELRDLIRLRADILQRYINGQMSLKAISLELGVSLPTVDKWLNREGVNRVGQRSTRIAALRNNPLVIKTPRILENPEMQMLYKRWQEGVSISKIAAMAGVKPVTMNGRISRYRTALIVKAAIETNKKAGTAS
jgi:uncharacterized protein YjcR